MYSCIVLGQELFCVFLGYLNLTFYVKIVFSFNDLYFFSGLGDNDVYIWKVLDFIVLFFFLKGYSGEVISVVWCLLDQGKVCYIFLCC